MSKRLVLYTDEIPRDYDHLKAARWASIDSGLAMLDGVGGSAKGPGGFLSGPLLGLSPLGESASAVSSANPFTAPSTNPGGAGGTSSGGPILGAVVNGAALSAGSGSTSAISVPIDVGCIYVLARTDATALPSSGAVQTTPLTLGFSATAQDYSDLAGSNTAVGVGAADATSLLARCVADALNVTQTDGGVPGAPALPGTTAGPNIAAAATAGHFSSFLIYALPVGSDVTDPDDPNLQAGATESLIPYYNPNNPGSPLAGPGGNGVAQATLRAQYAVYAVAASSVQNNASAQTSVNGLTLPANAVPLYIFVASHTTTDISTAAYVWPCVAGLTPPGGLTTPVGLLNGQTGFLAGHVQQHHLGIPGHAPKIDGGAEWLPLSAVNNNGQQLTNVEHTSTTITGSAHADSPVVIQSALIPIAVDSSWTPGGTPTTNVPSGVTVSIANAAYSYVLPIAGGMGKLFLYLDVVFTNTNGSGTPLVQGDFAGLQGFNLPVSFPNAMLSAVGSNGGYGLSSAPTGFNAQAGFTLQVAGKGNALPVGAVTQLDFAIVATSASQSIPASGGTLTVPVCFEVTGY